MTSVRVHRSSKFFRVVGTLALMIPWLGPALEAGFMSAQAQTVAEPAVSPPAVESLGDTVKGVLRGLLGEPGPRGWPVRHEGHRFDADLTFAQVVPDTNGQQIIAVLSASPREFYAGRATPELVQLLLLQRDDASASISPRARSAWKPLGNNGRPARVIGLQQVGAGRYAVVLRTDETWQGATRADYFLLSPRPERQDFVTLGGFGVFARLCHNSMQRPDCWSSKLEITAEPPAADAAQAACWSLRIVTRKVSDDGRPLSTRTDKVPCAPDGQYRTPKAFKGPFF